MNPLECYRLPWSLADNAISWLEVTEDCNLACEGCYRPHLRKHKTLATIAEELAVFNKLRKSDCINISGGEPLLHPDIVEIVRMVRQGGWKPVINTNGTALTPTLLHALKDAGIRHFIFHVDTSQHRKDCPAETERDLNTLRLKFAKLLAAEGDIGCAFNQTVGQSTLGQIGDTVRWAAQYPDIVQSVVFILFRSPKQNEGFDFMVNGQKVDLGQPYGATGWGGDRCLTTPEALAEIRKGDPDFSPSAYLSGSVDPASVKWLLGTRLVGKSGVCGCVGPKTMELTQTLHHFFTGRWLSYLKPSQLAHGKMMMLAGICYDPGLRRAAARFLKRCLSDPGTLFKPVHSQTIVIMQPADILADGRFNMCDSCPDMTVHNGQLYWSCRLEEIKKYGTFVTGSPL